MSGILNNKTFSILSSPSAVDPKRVVVYDETKDGPDQ